MGTRIRLSLACAAVILTFASVPVHAEWVENGIGISTLTGYQYDPCMLPDGSGGVFIAWEDDRTGTYDIYVQRVDTYGNELWTPGGVPACTAAGTQIGHAIVPDGAGGIILAWYDTRDQEISGSDIYAQRFNGAGNPLWTIDGVPVCTHPVNQQAPFMVSDGQAGAILAWDDPRINSNDILAQRIDGDGNSLWTPDGILICTATSFQYTGDIIADGDGGAVIVWQDYRNGNYDIYAQRVLPDSTSYWPLDGTNICTATGSQTSPRMIKHASGGLIIAWNDYRSGNRDIYAQKISLSNAKQWTADGIAVCAETGHQENCRIATDGGWGAIITWDDHRSSPAEIMAQKVTSDGTIAWASGGVPVSGITGGNKIDPEIIPDSEDGAIIAWRDYRSGSEYNLFAERINGAGVIQWSSDGIPLRIETGNSDKISIVSDGSGGAILAWRDYRNGTDSDIYSQRIERNGYWGYPSPVISTARDVPGDQGGCIILAWDASRLDPWPAGEIDYYSAWRAISESAAMALQKSGMPVLTANSVTMPEKDGSAILALETASGQYYWELVATVDAYELENYSATVPTLFDSTSASTEYSYFQVISHATDPGRYWISPVDSAYSVDNLAPAPPLGLAGKQSYAPEGLELTWDPNSESDLAGYNIYRGVSGVFIPGPGNFVASTPDTMTLDGDWSWETGYWYKVAAVDIHGNQSLFAVFRPDMVAGDDPMPLPDTTFLAQNFPNPFNPNTTIAFGLKKSGHVSLRIYDAAGRLVTTLVDESRPAGSYTAEWNGRDNNGSSVASGVYFYRLNAKEFEETKKMIMLR